MSARCQRQPTATKVCNERVLLADLPVELWSHLSLCGNWQANQLACIIIFSAMSKDTYKDICKYFGTGPMEEQISACQSKFYLRYCATESAVCHAISKLR